MNKSFLFLALFLLMGVGCSTGSVPLTSDFVPIQGKATAPGNIDASTEGPYERRLMTAISYDGITYTQNDAWIADQANVPDAVMKDGTIYLYYTGWILGDRINTSAVAISGDLGETWTYKYVELTDSDPIDRVVDPDIVLLEDGTFRLFFTAGNPQGIHYAEGTDGITFTYKGAIFQQTNDIAIDSTTFKVGDTWHMYALSDEGVSRLWHLTSTDGTTFSVYALTSFPIDQKPAMPANGVWIDDRYHLFMSTDDGSIQSQWSKKGFDWYLQEGTRLEPVDEEAYVMDPTIIALDDGRYLMFYVTNIP